MQTYIALLRGINVGGKNRLPMKALATLLADLGASDVRTYIQSGNVVFRSVEADAGRLAAAIGAAVAGQYGFTPSVLLLRPNELEAAIAANPFPEAVDNPSHLHLGFLAAAPERPNLEKLEQLKIPSERFELIGRTFYLHAPDGVARSKLAASSERLLGVPLTDRNWTTVITLREMAAA